MNLGSSHGAIRRLAPGADCLEWRSPLLLPGPVLRQRRRIGRDERLPDTGCDGPTASVPHGIDRIATVRRGRHRWVGVAQVYGDRETQRRYLKGRTRSTSHAREDEVGEHTTRLLVPAARAVMRTRDDNGEIELREDPLGEGRNGDPPRWFQQGVQHHHARRIAGERATGSEGTRRMGRSKANWSQSSRRYQSLWRTHADAGRSHRSAERAYGRRLVARRIASTRETNSSGRMTGIPCHGDISSKWASLETIKTELLARASSRMRLSS